MIRAMCVFGILCLIAIEVAAQDLRRIDEISTSDRGGRLYLEDWDSDGRLELIRCDTVGEYEISSAGKSLKYTQIYEARDGRWAIDRAFIHRYRQDELQFHPERPLLPHENDTAYRQEGDFNGDGMPDTLVAEPAVPVVAKDSGAPYVFRLNQQGKTLFEDPLYEMQSSGPYFNRFEVADLDDDGLPEILAWLMDYAYADRAIVYGTGASKWHGGTVKDVAYELTELLPFVDGVHAAVPEGVAPVRATLRPILANPGSDDILPVTQTQRFQVALTLPDGSQVSDLVPWREYFAKWAIGYVQRRSFDRVSPFLVELAHDLRISADGELLIADTAFEREVGGIPAGKYEFWLECPFMEREPNPFGWFGTVRTPRIQIEIAEKAKGTRDEN